MKTVMIFRRSSIASSLLAIAALSQAGTLTLNGLHTNSAVTWKLAGSQHTSGSGAFYGTYDSTVVDPTFCIDLYGWVTLPSSFAATRQTTFTAAGWLAFTYGAAASNSALSATALQLAIWNATYDSDLTVGGGNFLATADSFSGGAIAQANTYLAAMGTKKAWAYEYTRTAGGPGQSQISAIPGLTNAATPGPAGALVFAASLLRRRSRRRNG